MIESYENPNDHNVFIQECLEMGLLPGTKVCLLLKNKLLDKILVKINQMELAFRTSDAKKIFVKRINS